MQPQYTGGGGNQPQHHKIIPPRKDETLPAVEHKLAGGTELRLVIDQNEKVSIALVSGKVEIFGREITTDQPVVLTNAKVAVYAIQDSTIMVLLHWLVVNNSLGAWKC